MEDLASIFVIYLMLVLVWMLVAVFLLISIIKRKDMVISLKIFWCAIIIIAPVIGLVIYLIYNYNKEKRV